MQYTLPNRKHEFPNSLKLQVHATLEIVCDQYVLAQVDRASPRARGMRGAWCAVLVRGPERDWARAARRRGQEAAPANGGAPGRPSQRAAQGVPRPCCLARLMLFLPTRRREKAPRGFKLLYVDKTLL